MVRTRPTRLKGQALLLYAASEFDADMLYASGFFAPDPFILFQTARGRRYMVMSDLEIDRAKKNSRAHHVLSMSTYAKRIEEKTGKAPDVAEIISAVLQDYGIRRVRVPEQFPTGIADRLRAARIRVKAATSPFFMERLIKTEDEIREIRKSVRAAEAGMATAVAVLRKSKIRDGRLIYRGEPLTAEILKEKINTTVLSLGYLPSHTIVAAGRHGCDPHDEGSGPIRPNQPIIVDIFPRSEKTGYFGDITRTFVRGQAPEKLRAMHRAVLDGQRLGLAMIMDGMETKKIHQAILDLFEERGFPTGLIKGRMQGFFHGTGHGLGLDIHEPPRIAINDLRLEKGMVVTVEPGLYYFPLGGVRIEDTVLVTKKGIKNLSRFPKLLEL